MYIGRVFAYKNLNNKCYSIRAEDGKYKGKVILHTRRIWLYNCELKVSEAGRQRVIREGSKNIHAGVSGNILVLQEFVQRQEPYDLDFTGQTYARPLLSIDQINFNKEWHNILYNPYTCSKFQLMDVKYPRDSVPLNIEVCREIVLTPTKFLAFI